MQPRHSKPFLSERAKLILKILIKQYIKMGEPVGSKTLSGFRSVSFCSATIRGIMADLEEKGFLQQTHTSGGRVPTIAGYHFFVDQLLPVHPIQKKHVESYQKQWQRTLTMSEVIKTASKLLSALTKLVGLVTFPQKTKIILRKVEFLPLSSERILAILVVNETEVQSFLVPVKQVYTARELEQVGHHLNRHYSGMELSTINALLAGDGFREHQKIEFLIPVFSRAQAALESETSYLVDGQTQFLKVCETHNLKRTGDVLEILDQKKVLLRLLDTCVERQALQLFIGPEVGSAFFNEYAFVALPYSISGTRGGALGVMGPMRMAYGKVIPTVHWVAELLSRVLECKEQKEDL